jgi:hypothetical protein
MGDDNYVRELKQGAVGTKLPTMLDLTPRSENNFSSRLETPTARNYLANDEVTGKPIIRKEKTPQDISAEIAARIRQLHYEGRRLDEIYEILESEGYEYSAIEPVFMDYLNKLRPAPKGQAPQTQGRFQGQNAPMPRTFTPTPEQMATRGTVPMQRPDSAQMQNLSVNQNFSPNSPDNSKNNLEIVELNQAASKGIPPREEVPTNIPKEASDPMEPQGFVVGSPDAENDGMGPIGGSDFAPLFVKVGKYRETLEDLNDLENYLRAMSRLFEIVEELEKVRVMNIEALNKIHKKALVTASKLSSGLLKPKGMSIEGTRESDVELSKLGDVIGDLSKELSMLKKEVDKFNRLE